MKNLQFNLQQIFNQNNAGNMIKCAVTEVGWKKKYINNKKTEKFLKENGCGKFNLLNNLYKNFI